jgi:hypothetical protein
MLSSITIPALAAQKPIDDKDDSPLKDFDIKDYRLSGNGDAVITLYGKAGRTVPEGMTNVYAYVVITDKGIFATDSHEAQHAESEGETTANKAWHGHKVTIEENAGPNGRDCLTEIGSFASTARMSGKHVIITDVNAEIESAMTLRLELLVEDPDTVPEGECIAEVAVIFDEASL